MRWCRGSVRPPPVGDLRDFDRYAVVAAEGYGSLGKALTGQSLTDDLLYRVHVVGQVAGVVAVRDFGLVYDTGAADQIQTQTDTIVGIEYARDDGLQTGVCRVCGIGRSRVSRGVSRRIRAVCLVVRLVCAAVGREVSLVSVADVSDVAVFRNGMVQPPGMYTPVTAVTPRKMMISMTAIKEVTLFFTCKCLL